ncbi:MAG TPA: hypothetical protein VKU01_33825 [Bryobacteraceae bacterium]|nr:hypothetical protein [Bryobacteraceae bacterium]
MSLGSKRWPLVAMVAAFCALGLSFSAQALVAHWNGDRLQVAAPGLHFLTGRALERLHNGVTVPFNFQLTLTTIPRSFPLERELARFDVSYDVWEERFTVFEARSPRRAASHMTSNQAEVWCVDRMSVAASTAPGDKDLWLRLEIRADESSGGTADDSSLSLARLIDIFSRPARSQQEWVAETQPFQLRNLKR